MSIFQPNPRSPKRSDYTGARVYFARCVGFPAVKIGCSHYVLDRLKAVKSNLPFDMELIGQFPGNLLDEKYVHVALLKHRLGGEFYADCDEVREWYEHARDFEAPLHPIPALKLAHSVNSRRMVAFGEKHGITTDKIAQMLQVDRATVKRYALKAHHGSSHYLAAMAVLAHRAGADISTIWRSPKRRNPSQREGATA